MKLLTVLTALAVCSAAFAADAMVCAALATDATPSAIVVDDANGDVISCTRCDDPVPPSSMSKLMAIELVFQRMKSGRIWADDHYRVTRSAFRRAHLDDEAKLGLAINDFVSVDDLLKGMIVQSAGDACLVLAEGIGGSEAGFVAMMNDRAAELGLESTHFTNTRGLADDGEYMSAHDIARLSSYIIHTYPAYYRYFGLKSFTWKGRRFINRNPLLGMAGVDGLKTGHTQAGGYGLATSAMRGTRRVIVVVNGLASERERQREAWRLVELGFAAESSRHVASEGAAQVSGSAGN